MCISYYNVVPNGKYLLGSRRPANILLLADGYTLGLDEVGSEAIPIASLIRMANKVYLGPILRVTGALHDDYIKFAQPLITP